MLEYSLILYFCFQLINSQQTPTADELQESRTRAAKKKETQAKRAAKARQRRHAKKQRISEEDEGDSDMEADVQSVPGDITIKEEDVTSVVSEEEAASEETFETPKKRTKMSIVSRILKSPREEGRASEKEKPSSSTTKVNI